VDALLVLDRFEPGGGQQALVLVAGQGAGDAARSLRHVGAHRRIEVGIGDHVADGHPPAGAQHARDLAQHRALSAERLITQLEMTTSTEASGSLWRDQRVIVEVDGFETHGTRTVFESDRIRDAELQAGTRSCAAARAPGGVVRGSDSDSTPARTTKAADVHRHASRPATW